MGGDKRGGNSEVIYDQETRTSVMNMEYVGVNSYGDCRVWWSSTLGGAMSN